MMKTVTCCTSNDNVEKGKSSISTCSLPRYTAVANNNDNDPEEQGNESTLLSSLNGMTRLRKGESFCGCCCDLRCAVIVINVIAFFLKLALYLSIGHFVSLVFLWIPALAIYGAIAFKKWAIMIKIVWISMTLLLMLLGTFIFLSGSNLWGVFGDILLILVPELVAFVGAVYFLLAKLLLIHDGDIIFLVSVSVVFTGAVYLLQVHLKFYHYLKVGIVSPVSRNI